MMVIRPVERDDLSQLMALAGKTGGGLTSLPVDSATFQASIVVVGNAMDLERSPAGDVALHRFLQLLSDQGIPCLDKKFEALGLKLGKLLPHLFQRVLLITNLHHLLLRGFLFPLLG